MSGTAPENDVNRGRSTVHTQELPSMLVVQAVASATGEDPTDMDPLYAVVDPDALDALFVGGVEGRVHFDYHDCEVAVYSDGRVTVGDVDAGGR